MVVMPVAWSVIYQFDKVEMVQIVRPEDSMAALEG